MGSVGISRSVYVNNPCSYTFPLQFGHETVGHYELLGLVSNVAKRLQQEAFIEKKFGRKLPIIIHGLEYAWFDIEATQNANINGEAEVFLKAMKELGMC